MKYLKKVVVTALVFTVLFQSCNNKNTPANNGKTATDNTAGSDDDLHMGNASFSATIDGVAVSGSGVQSLGIINAAFIYPATNDRPETVLFYLNTTKKGDDFYGFRFSFPDKEGAHNRALKDSYKDCNCSLVLDYNLKSTDNFARYDGKDLQVNFTKLTSSVIQGTFSGTFTLSADTRSKPYKAQVVVTDGKFDIPFSTGNIRPE